MRRLRWSSLVVRFAVLSLVALIGLGTALAVGMHSMIESRAKAEAERMGVVTTRLMFRALTAQSENGSATVTDMAAELAQGEGAEDVASSMAALAVPGINEQLAVIGDTMSDARLQADLMGANAWFPDGTLVFSSDPTLRGQRLPLEPGVVRALAGEANTSVLRTRQADDSYIRGEGPVLLVYVPIALPLSEQTFGVAELALPYTPIEEAVRHDTVRTVAALAIGLVLLWLVLFRVVLGASRRLREQAETNRHLALHDMLTGLPNRVLLRDRASVALAKARRSRKVTGLLLLDLDRFKEINDTLGHAVGDGLLLGVAERLRQALREGDTAVRLSGDEFAVLVTDLGGPDEVHALATRVQEMLHKPFLVEGVTLDVEASIGIALAPVHGDDIDTLLRCADVAMYEAKSSRSGIEVYDSERDENTPARLALLGDLRRALEDGGQLGLHYQPKVSLDGQTLVGVEALLRWAHPTRGAISPSEFIPVAEGTGLIHPLTQLTLDLAIEQVGEWLRAGHEVAVAVNVSTRCLLDVDLPVRIEAILRQHAVPARLLRLEITESTLIADPNRALSVLNHLASLGIRLSIDDFGTGFSSMSYLKRLPIDELKVDRSFVTDMASQPADEAVVRSIVELGHNLGLHVVAEGVETDQAVSALRDLGCDVAQGFLFARPMTACDLESWMAQLAARVPGLDTGSVAKPVA